MASRQERKRQSRERIERVALELLAADAAPLTTGRVAEAAGLSQASFYSHFDSLDALAEALAERVCRPLDEAASAPDLPHALAALRRDPVATAVIRRHRVRGHGPLAAALLQAEARWVDALEARDIRPARAWIAALVEAACIEGQ